MPPVPTLPDGMTLAQFGLQVMRWGSGDAAAVARIATITYEELQAAGITPEIAGAWCEFYEEVVSLSPHNPSARGRAKLMEHARNLLEEPSK